MLQIDHEVWSSLLWNGGDCWNFFAFMNRWKAAGRELRSVWTWAHARASMKPVKMFKYRTKRSVWNVRVRKFGFQYGGIDELSFHPADFTVVNGGWTLQTCPLGHLSLRTGIGSLFLYLDGTLRTGSCFNRSLVIQTLFKKVAFGSLCFIVLEKSTEECNKLLRNTGRREDSRGPLARSYWY